MGWRVVSRTAELERVGGRQQEGAVGGHGEGERVEQGRQRHEAVECRTPRHARWRGHGLKGANGWGDGRKSGDVKTQCSTAVSSSRALGPGLWPLAWCRFNW
jgi:hypothetical protein